MAEPTPEQRAAIRDATLRMRAMGVHDDGYPDARRNGDVFITFRIADLFPLIALAEAGHRAAQPVPHHPFPEPEFQGSIEEFNRLPAEQPRILPLAGVPSLQEEADNVAALLRSGHAAGDPADFAHQVDRLIEAATAYRGA